MAHTCADIQFHIVIGPQEDCIHGPINGHHLPVLFPLYRLIGIGHLQQGMHSYNRAILQWCSWGEVVAKSHEHFESFCEQQCLGQSEHRARVAVSCLCIKQD